MADKKITISDEIDLGYYLTNAYNAILAIEDFDPMTKEEKEVKKRIKDNSFKVIDKVMVILAKEVEDL